MANSIPGEKQVIARLRMEGGMIPRDREWVFYSSGQVRHPDGQLRQGDLSGISLIVDTVVKRMTKSNLFCPVHPGSADSGLVTLFLQTPSGVWQCSAADASDDVPDWFWPTIEGLQDLADESLL